MAQKRCRGDILEAKNRAKTAGRHFIVYYSGNNDNDFIGGMITHKLSEKNKLMEETHFGILDKKGIKNKVIYDNTSLVIAKLVKFESWGPFTKVGKLSKEGVKFVVDNIGKLSAETWDEYLMRTKN
jgi:hypothetical protein